MRIFFLLFVLFPAIMAFPINREEMVQAHYYIELHQSASLECGEIKDRTIVEDVQYEWLNIKFENGTDASASRITTDTKTGRLFIKSISNTHSKSFFCRLSYRLKGTMEKDTYIIENIVHVYTRPDWEGNCMPGYELFKGGLTKISRCYACPPGEYSEGQKCRACPLSTYNSDYAQDKCLNCPSGQFTFKYGQKTVGDCMGLSHMQDHFLIWLSLLVPLLLLQMAVGLLLWWRIRKIWTDSKRSDLNIEEGVPLLQPESPEECPPASDRKSSTSVQCPVSRENNLDHSASCSQTALHMVTHSNTETDLVWPNPFNHSTQAASTQTEPTESLGQKKEEGFQGILGSNVPSEKPASDKESRSVAKRSELRASEISLPSESSASRKQRARQKMKEYGFNILQHPLAFLQKNEGKNALLSHLKPEQE